jgi:choline-phosphate cytidylyltransferase
VRDYDQYIDRQLKRGTSRRELNVSWLKKNELDFKRNMAEFRDSIKANWATTGQELSKDIRQFWQSSRPASPARTPTREVADQLDAHGASARSPSALSRLSHLDIPGRGSTGARESSDFAAGYNLGLIGGVRSWVCLLYAVNVKHGNKLTMYQMARSRRNLNDSRPPSPHDDSSSDELDTRSPQEAPRGRTGKQTKPDAMDTAV